MDKTTDERTNAGAGWLNPDGSITIRLNPAVVLQANPNHVITVFPVEKQNELDTAASR